MTDTSVQWQPPNSTPPPVWTSAASPSASPPLVLGGASDKSPVDTDRLAHHVLTVEPFHGCLGLFVCLILHKSIPLEVACSAVKVEMQVLDFSKLWELVMDVFLCGLFVYACHKQDPALHRSLRSWLIPILFHSVIVLFDSGSGSFLWAKASSFPLLCFLFQLVDALWWKKVEEVRIYTSFSVLQEVAVADIILLLSSSEK